MSNDYNAMNPYATPGQPLQAELGPAGKNEGKITAIAVIALILGILGILISLFSFVGIAMQGFIQNQFANNPQLANDPGVKMQLEIQAVQAKYFSGLVVQNVMHLILAVCLTVGGALSLSKKPGGYRFLAKCCGAAVIFEILRAIFTTILQIDSTNAMMSGMQRSMEAEMQKTGNAAPVAVVQTAMYFGIGIGVCFTLVFVLVKIGFYIWGMSTLNKEAARISAAS